MVESLPRWPTAFLEEIAAARVVDLTMLLDNSQTVWPGHGPFAHLTWISHAQGALLLGRDGPSRVGMMSDRVEMPLHAGTHLDALNHFSVDGRMHGDRPVQAAVGGPTSLGIEQAPIFFCSGVLLDVAAASERPLAAGDVVDVDLLVAAMSRQGIDALPRGGAVLLNTGWLDRHYRHSRRVYFEGEPGIDAAAARYLADAGVALIGADTSAVEAVPFAHVEDPYPAHQELLVRRGVYLLENTVTQSLVESGIDRFVLVAGALRIAGGSGSPVRAFALADGDHA